MATMQEKMAESLAAPANFVNTMDINLVYGLVIVSGLVKGYVSFQKCCPRPATTTNEKGQLFQFH